MFPACEPGVDHRKSPMKSVTAAINPLQSMPEDAHMPKKLPQSSALALHTPSRSQKQASGGWRDQPIRISIEITAFPSGRLNEDVVSRYQLDNSVLPYNNTIPIGLVKAVEVARKRQLRVLLTYALDPEQPHYGQYVPTKPIQGYVCKRTVYLSKTPRAAADDPNCDHLHEDCLLKVECADPADGDVLWEASVSEQA